MPSQTLSQLLKKPLFYNFNELNKTYRESGHEELISAWLYQWGVVHGFETKRDQYNNVMMRIPATPGYEQAPVVMLQAHMDMVCDKEGDSMHNFLQDPITMKLENRMLCSACGTSLGADDGIGIAMIQTLITEPEQAHPALEVLFTASEETTMGGAVMVDGSWFSAHYLINLDHGVEDEVLAGGCGGVAAQAKLPVQREAADLGDVAFVVEIAGMPGGHSGEDIAKGRGNANVLMGRLLLALERELAYGLTDIDGGTQRQSIAWRARAVLQVQPALAAKLQQTVEKMTAVLRLELEAGAPGLRITLTPIEKTVSAVLTGESLHKLICMLLLSPNGVQEMSGALRGIVESSTNVGVVALSEDTLTVTHELRGSFASTKYAILDKLILLMDLLGGTVTPFDDYPEWPYLPQSALRERAQALFLQEFGRPMATLVVHAGIEVGAIRAHMPHLDGISIGPNCYDYHSPQERMEVASVERVYGFVKKLVASIR